MNEVSHKHQRYPPSFSRSGRTKLLGLIRLLCDCFPRLDATFHIRLSVTSYVSPDEAFGKWQVLWEIMSVGSCLKAVRRETSKGWKVQVSLGSGLDEGLLHKETPGKCLSLEVVHGTV